MLFSPAPPAPNPTPGKPAGVWYRPTIFAHRHSCVAFVLVVILSNGAGSVFNFLYNYFLIVSQLNPSQAAAFWWGARYYNAVAYTYGLAAVLVMIWPLHRCRRELCSGAPARLAPLDHCRRLLVNIPYYAVWLCFAGWLPGALFFPLIICMRGGWEPHGWWIWRQFAVSFGVSALLTTTQTFFAVEAFLIRFFYPDFFQGARPADVAGAHFMPFRWRMLLYWLAVAVAPVVAMLAVALNLGERPFPGMHRVAIGVAVGTALATWFIGLMVGSTLLRWVQAHAGATEQIARGNDEVRINELRPDEWGKLTDHFNDMAAALGRARYVRETFGQFVGSDVLETILGRFPGLGGKVEEITVLFADIRGFTLRIAGEDPDRSVELLNRFLSLSVAAVEAHDGWVNKFLGDGIIALFGAPRYRADHADLAVRAAVELLARLTALNRDLEEEGQRPLVIGIGIHTGLALVGCIGATLEDSSGRKQVRRELTAIGETVNLSQRLEQLTKVCTGPILISEQTRVRLCNHVPLTDLGMKRLPGYDGTVRVHRVDVSP